jgi:dual specificity tyrosine-phosphorylation-regulated kinase 2/3/4
LKPENILLKNSNKSSIRLIDFGTACIKSSNYYSYIQSRYYGAPEVLLKLDYDEKIDIWSLGCIAYELLTGTMLFNGKNEHEQLCKIVSVIGFPPLTVIDKIKKKSKDFNIQALKGIPKVSLRKVLANYDIIVVEFIESCLTWNYEERISASEGLKCSWIKGNRRSLSETPRMVNSI